MLMCQFRQPRRLPPLFALPRVAITTHFVVPVDTPPCCYVNHLVSFLDTLSTDNVQGEEREATAGTDQGDEGFGCH